MLLNSFLDWKSIDSGTRHLVAEAILIRCVLIIDIFSYEFLWFLTQKMFLITLGLACSINVWQKSTNVIAYWAMGYSM